MAWYVDENILKFLQLINKRKKNMAVKIFFGGK